MTTPAARDRTLTPNALRVLRARCLACPGERGPRESPHEMFARVAGSVAAAEATWDPGAVAYWEGRFLEALGRLEFLPNSTVLMNAGRSGGLLPACYVLPVTAGEAGVARAVALADRIHVHGAGTGFRASALSTGHPPGPVAFLERVDGATRALAARSPRCGANMGVLDADHPDILEFVRLKRREGAVPTFNLSVGVNDDFMRAVRAGRPVEPTALFEEIAESAWHCGDPGLLFLDAIERANPTPWLGRLQATNPCGEVPLLPYESCVLGSINLPRLLCREGYVHVDWERLDHVVRLATRFLDDVIEVTDVPHPEVRRAMNATRKIGIGVMGLAELLAELGLAYASEEAVGLGGEIMRHIAASARDASHALAEVRGPFPAHAADAAPGRDSPPRNATLTSIAPTGTISVIGGTTPGIEPFFGLAWRREGVLGAQRLSSVEPALLRWLAAHDVEPSAILESVCARGRLPAEVPELAEARPIFATATEVPARAHLAMQAAFQRHVDNAVSKTVALAEDATPADVREVYVRAWRLGLKGVTVFRAGSRRDSVVQLGLAGERRPPRGLG